jgi:hypothetical protein
VIDNGRKVLSTLVAFIGSPVALVSDMVTLIGSPVALVSDMVTLVGSPVALVSGLHPRVEVVLRPVQGRGASGQAGLGFAQRRLGLLGSRLGRPRPGVTEGKRGDPLTLRPLDDLAGKVSDSALRRPGLRAELLERPSGVTPSVATSTPLACSIQTRLVSARRSWATSSSRRASSNPVRSSSAVTIANAPTAWTSSTTQTRGSLTYTSSVPTGCSASRTGTLSTPRTCSWATTAATRSQPSAAPRSSTATTRSSV